MKKFTLILTASLLITGIVLLAVPSDNVFAQEIDPPQLGRERRQNRFGPNFFRGFKDLERHFERLVDRYEDVGYRINDTDDITRKLEDRIEVLIEEGEDPAELEVILGTFNENMDAVRAAHDEIGEIIAEHAGFNDGGEVQDERDALLTLREIAEGMLEVHQLGEDARLALRWDLLTLWHQNNPEE